MFRFNNLKERLGRNPMLSELVSDEDAMRIGTLVSEAPEEIGAPVGRAVTRRALERQDEVAARIRGGRAPLSPEGARVRRDLFTNAVFQKFENDPVVMTGRVAEFLQDPKTMEAISGGTLPSGNMTGRELRSRLLRAADGDDSVIITARDLENVRVVANNNNFRDVGQEAREILGEQIPELEPVLQSFARRSQRIEGIETGPALVREGVSTSPVPGGRQQTLDDVIERERPAEQAGVRRGAREDLARRAENSPGGARQVLGELGESSAPSRRLEQVLPEGEGRALRDFAQAEQQASRSLSTIARSAFGASVDKIERLAVEGSQLGRAGGAMRAAWFLCLRRFLGLSDDNARRIARALTDPEQTEAVLAELAKLGATKEFIERSLVQVSAAAGLTSSAVRDQSAANL